VILDTAPSPLRSKRKKQAVTEIKPVNQLIESLRNAAAYPHPASSFQVIETHISWVILTGAFAYKIKKPVNLGFLDFSTLSQRRDYCYRELNLNKRTAEKLYVDVVAITGTATEPKIAGDGEPIEYAVRMRQFDQGDIFDNLQREGRLTPELLIELAKKVANFHQRLPPMEADSPLGTSAELLAAMLENFEQIRPLLGDSDSVEQLDALENWTRQKFGEDSRQIDTRREEGYVRECHGDLHLANITVFDGEVTLFDCIEFNDSLRWIDVMNDLAFLLMDLEFRGKKPLANLVLNTYLEYRDDYGGVALLVIYKAYRAMVRAKVSMLTLENQSLNSEQRNRLGNAYRDYISLARSCMQRSTPFLLATTGLSASGKSHVSAKVSGALNLIRLRSDVERKRLFGLGPLDASHSPPGDKLYSPDATWRTYQRLATLAGQLLAAGVPVIVDAACLKRQERNLLAGVAREQGVPFALVHCEAPESQRLAWIRKRSGDASEATEALMDIQKSWYEPLTDGESKYVIAVQAAEPDSVESLAHRVELYLESQGS